MLAPHDKGVSIDSDSNALNPNFTRALESFGVDDSSMVLVPWIPAIELAWVGGLDESERARLLHLIRERHTQLSPRSEALVRDWLRRPPAKALFRTARRVLRKQLHALAPAERPALRARIIGPCVDIADASGGPFGLRTLSREEQAWLDTLVTSLQTDAAPSAIDERSA